MNLSSPLLFKHSPSSNDLSTPPISILGVRLDNLKQSEIRSRVRRFFYSGRPHHIVTLNSLMILEAEKTPLLKTICERASMVVPDSSGISWAASLFGFPDIERFPGIDLAFELCQMAQEESLPIYLLGGQTSVAEEAAKGLFASFPLLQISGMRDGYFNPQDEPALIRDIANSQARLVLVALGMPRQETWIYEHLSVLPPAIYIGVGGSFDVWSGRSKRAPFWLRNLGLEWLYRLKKEPFRWKRIARLPQFALKVLLYSRFA